MRTCQPANLVTRALAPMTSTPILRVRTPSIPHDIYAFRDIHRIVGRHHQRCARHGTFFSAPPDLTASVWPSMLYAAELAAWHVLLGVALVFDALALDECKRLRVIRIGLYSARALCLAGMVGPMLDRMPLAR